jgi:hypothetical protein
VALALATWDGSTAGAESLRAAVKAIREVPHRRLTDNAERALGLAVRACRKSDPAAVTREEGLEWWLGPFIGDPALGSWPFDDALGIDDEEAITWLPLVAHCAIVTESVRTFVRIMFRTRRRDTWVPAARAAAMLALRDAEIAAWLKALWVASFPAGLDGGSPSPEDLVPDIGVLGIDKGDRVHVRRHVLFAASVWLSAGGDAQHFPGLSVQTLAGLPLEPDDSDASVVLRAFIDLLGGQATRPVLLPLLPDRLGHACTGEMSEAALRDLADVLRQFHGDAAAEAAFSVSRTTLLAPRWLAAKHAKRVDALWSWLDTAAWCRRNDDRSGLEEMARAATGLPAALQARLDDGAAPAEDYDPVADLVEHLQAILSSHVWATTLDEQRATLVVETLLSLRRVDLAELPWGDILGRAMERIKGVSTPPLDGALGKVGAASLALLLAGRNYSPAVLLRDRQFDQATVLALAVSGDRFISRQLAIQVDRLLRRAGSIGQLRLLWNLLQADPPGETFKQIKLTLRGSGTGLHGIVGEVTALDALRDRGAPAKDVADQYCVLTRQALEWLHIPAGVTGGLAQAGEVAIDVTACLEQIPSGLREVVRATDEGAAMSGEWLRSLELLLLGDDADNHEQRRRYGLKEWLTWLGTPVPALAASWAEFRSVADTVRSLDPAVPLSVCDRLAAALDALNASIRHAAWPEVLLVRHALDAARCWHRALLVRARSSWRASEEVRGLMDRGDEHGLTERLSGTGRGLEPTIALVLPAEDLRAVHRYLLRHLRFREASRLRREAHGRVRLPASVMHLAPLLATVMAGPLLILDMGTAWNDIVGGHPRQYATTVCLALAVSLALLFYDLAGRGGMGTASTRRGRLASAAAMLLRVLQPFGLAFVLAFLVSALVLWTLSGTSTAPAGGYWAQVVLWSCLSLFLGIVVQLVLQGRGAVRE